MTCCHCQDATRVFDTRFAKRDVRRYRRKGPDGTTRSILEALEAHGARSGSLLDIGGGIGVIVHELIADGVNKATLVEAAPAYLAAAREEAARRGHADRIRFMQGDFVDFAAEVPAADVVTLDRVVCCYPDCDALLRAASSKATKLLVLSYPRDRWFVRAMLATINLSRWLLRSAFRVFAHSPARMCELIEAAGFRRQGSRDTPFWQVAVFERSDSA
jgi:magnesium-protoporphyrin O-methyltransferase